MLNDYNSSKVADTSVTFEIWQNDILLETTTATLDASGNYQFETIAEGPVTIKAKASHWLAQAKSVNLQPQSTITIDFSLINGDMNNDNKINVLDYVVLKSNYNKTGLTGHAADLNGDGNINVLDYVILKKNYNKIGD